MILSVVMVTNNSADVVEGALQSVVGLWDELLVGDGGSRDGTVEMVKKYGGVIIRQIRPILPIRPMNETMVHTDKKGGMRRKNLGERKQELVEKAKGDWILVLDADERVSQELYQEIKSLTHSPRRSHTLRLRSGLPPFEVVNPVAYRIPYQNYMFGSPVYYGGEKYAKVRLFRKGFAKVSPEPIHEEIILRQELPKARPSQRLRPGLEEGNVGELCGVIHHHSYRTPWQLFTKFTRYAWVSAGMLIQKQKPGFQRSKPGFEDAIKKLFLYGPHMFWVRYIIEKGYRDGWRGLVLALAFGYMEGLMYWFYFTRTLLAEVQGESLNTMKCLCGRMRVTRLFTSGLYDVVKCAACGQVRIVARKGAKRTGYYKEEDVQFYTDHQEMFRRLFREKLEFIRAYAPAGTMLDIGAGVGLFLDEARKMGYRIRGLEPSKASVAAARKHFGIRLDSRLRGNDRVDIIVINHVLEHLANPRTIIKYASKSLSAGGTLVIGVPNFNSFMRWIKRGKWQSLVPIQHLWQFTLTTLDQLVKPHGFRRIAVSYDNHDRSIHYWWKKPVYWILDRIALATGYAEAMLVIYQKI